MHINVTFSGIDDKNVCGTLARNIVRTGDTTELDAAKERHAQLMTKLDKYKKSLIYYAVTGKIEC